EKRVFLVILFTSFSGSLVSRISGAVQDVVTHFPIAFPNRCLRVLVSQDYTPDSGAVGYIACAGFSPDPVKFISRASTPGLGASFLALGC
ncbi:gp53-like domain-containing protein, partial [Escherichia coli]|uniref:gp53-like domain-containing protein n=1 Tax=Escherichia coli TaxID=562 RepID=UPI003F81FCAA